MATTGWRESLRAGGRAVPAAVTNHSQAGMVFGAGLRAAMAVSPWDRYRVWQANLQPRGRKPPVTEQLNDVARQNVSAKLAELRAGAESKARRKPSSPRNCDV